MNQAAQSGVNRRMDPRVAPGEGWIDIEGLRYEVRDVSVSGIRIRPYAGGHQIGGSFTFKLHLRGEAGKDIVIDGGAVVVRILPGEMAAQFFYLDSEQYPQFNAYLEHQFRISLNPPQTTH